MSTTEWFMCCTCMWDGGVSNECFEWKQRRWGRTLPCCRLVFLGWLCGCAQCDVDSVTIEARCRCPTADGGYFKGFC